jgi:hypothetical protein
VKRWWSPLVRRAALLRAVHRRGDTLLFAHSLGFALVVPLLLRLPLPRVEALLERAARAGRPGDADAVAATVLDMLQAGRPLVRRGCLTRGLTLYYFLRRAGVDVTLTFGMGHAEGGDGFDGHCWLVRDGQPYLEARDPRGLYAEMYSFRAVSASWPQPAGAGAR